MNVALTDHETRADRGEIRRGQLAAMIMNIDRNGISQPVHAGSRPLKAGGMSR